MDGSVRGRGKLDHQRRRYGLVRLGEGPQARRDYGDAPDRRVVRAHAPEASSEVGSMFFKFPHTPHLLWLGKTPCRGDKVFGLEEARAFLNGQVTVEEKMEGTNIGLSLDESGALRVQSRGSYLARGSHPQFQPLWPWIEARRFGLVEALRPGLMLFGEWCFARHSVPYNRLPDWFLGFDVYERAADRFWSPHRRDRCLHGLGLSPAPP